MSRSILSLLAASAVVLTGACDKSNQAVKTTSGGRSSVSSPADSAQARGHSMVRLVNAVNGGGAVALEAGDETLFPDVKAGGVSDYREVSSTLAHFAARAPGASDSSKIARKDHVMIDGNRYSVLVISEDMSKRVLRVMKDEVVPDAGKARIRIIHAAPGAPNLDVMIVGSSDLLFSGVSFKDDAGYKDIMPATVSLEFRAKDQTKRLLRLERLELKPGTTTNIVITGAGALHAFTFTDAPLQPTPKA
ncbi:MAG: DUF4397 domain-containing protein [Gemmatimonadetes bacterium]|nr:DUF4397 domain-containing protein [Gemmatimonadota bacterium]